MATRCFKVLVSTLLLVSLSPSSALIGNSSLPDYRLMRDLFDGYNPAVCPKSSADEPIEVAMDYVLMSVNNVDEKEQVIAINGWLILSWTDAFLQWDPALYEDIDMIVIPSKKIWLPDIAFENSVDNLFLDVERFAATVSSDGTVNFLPGGPITLLCPLNLTNFPFDVQICSIDIVSWTTPERAMIYKLGSFTKDLLVENGQWNIADLNASYIPFRDDGETFSEVFLHIMLQRKPLYQAMNTILPVIMMSFLNLAVFRLPPDSGEKVSLSITVLLAYAVWLLMMSSITPTTSDNLPLVETFITLFMGVSTISVFVTVFIIRLNHGDDSTPVPQWMKKLFCVRCGRSARSSSVKQLDSTDSTDSLGSLGSTDSAETVTWKMMAQAADRVAFYTILAVTVIMLLTAIGIIGCKSAYQPVSFK